MILLIIILIICLILFFADYHSFKQNVLSELDELRNNIENLSININYCQKKVSDKTHYKMDSEQRPKEDEISDKISFNASNQIGKYTDNESAAMYYTELNNGMEEKKNNNICEDKDESTEFDFSELANDIESKNISNENEQIFRSEESEQTKEYDGDDKQSAVKRSLDRKEDSKQLAANYNTCLNNKEDSDFNFEKMFLGNLFNKIGAFSIIIALCYFLSKIYWTPLMQVIFAYFSAIAIFLISIYLKGRDERYKNFSSVLMGVALSSLFIVTYYGVAISSIIPAAFGLLIGIFLLITAYFVSKMFNSIAFIIIGLSGGYLTPFLISSATDINYLALYYIFINIVSAIFVHINTNYKVVNNCNLIITSCILLCFNLFNVNLSIVYPLILWSVYFVSEILLSIKNIEYSNCYLSLINYVILCIYCLSYCDNIHNFKFMALIFTPVSILYCIVSYLIKNKNELISVKYKHLFVCSVLISILWGLEDLTRILMLIVCGLTMIYINNIKKGKNYFYWINIYLGFALIYTAIYSDNKIRIILSLLLPLLLILLNKYIDNKKNTGMISLYFMSSIVFIFLLPHQYIRIFIAEIMAFVLMVMYKYLDIDNIKDVFKTNYAALYFIAGAVFISCCTKSVDLFGYTIQIGEQRVYLYSILALIMIFIMKIVNMNQYLKYGVGYVIASFASLLFIPGLYIVYDIENYKPLFNYRTCVFFMPIITSFISAYSIKNILHDVYNYLRFLAITGIYVFISLEINLIITKQQGLSELPDTMFYLIKCMTIAMVGFVYTLNMLNLSKITKLQVFEYASLLIYIGSLVSIMIGCVFGYMFDWNEYFIPIVNIRFIAFMFAIAVTYILSKYYNSKELKYFMTVIGTVLVACESFNIFDDNTIATSIAVLLYSSILIIIGIIRNNEILKKSGIVITILVILKILGIDLIDLDTKIKVVIFLIIGILLLILSYVYLKITKKKS